MYQQTIIVGNLGKDPVLRFTKEGKAVCDFSVAVNEKWDGGESTVWFRVTCWDRLAETCNEYLSKGRQVMVIGKISTSAYLPKDGGDPRASLDLTARDVRFLSGGQERDDGQGYGPTAEEQEIPF